MTKREFLLVKQKIARDILAINQWLELTESSERGENDTMINPELQVFIDEMNAATTAIAKRIAAINVAALSAEDKAALQAEVDILTAMGKDPATPIPPAALAS